MLEVDTLTLAIILRERAILSGIISHIYNYMNKVENNNFMMMQTLVWISVAISGAMMVIGNNLAFAFGLVGAVSIIRFRLAVKNPRDMAFVLFAIVIGMACGIGFLTLAITILIESAIIMLCMGWILGWMGKRNSHCGNYELKITHNNNVTITETIEKELNKIATSWYFKGSKESKNKKTLTYTVRVDNYRKLEEEFTKTLKRKCKKDLFFISFDNIG